MDIGLDLGALGGAGLSSIMNMITTGYWNRKQMEREDTAVQRQMADLKAAGINPLMAANTNGASTGNYQAPQVDSNLLANAMSSQMKFQLGEQKEAYKQAQLQTKAMENELNDLENERFMDSLDYFGLFNKMPTHLSFNYDKNGKLNYIKSGKSPYSGFQSNFDNYLNYIRDNADAIYAETKAGKNYNQWFSGMATPEWFGTELAMDKIAQFIPGVSGLANAFANVYRSTKGTKTFNFNDNHSYNRTDFYHYKRY